MKHKFINFVRSILDYEDIIIKFKGDKVIKMPICALKDRVLLNRAKYHINDINENDFEIFYLHKVDFSELAYVKYDNLIQSKDYHLSEIKILEEILLELPEDATIEILSFKTRLNKLKAVYQKELEDLKELLKDLSDENVSKKYYVQNRLTKLQTILKNN